jgi:hypothetical protein
MDPMNVLKAAIQAVPAMKYALAVAAIGAVVAIALGFRNGAQSLVFGGLIVVGLMFILVIFSHYATAQPANLGPATVLVWFYTIAIMLATTLFGVSYFSKLWDRGPVPDLTRLRYFDGSWMHEKTDTVTWAAGACAVSEVSITTHAKLNLNELNSETGVYTGNYVYEYSGKVIHDGTPNHDCRWYQSNRPDYHYKMFRTAVIRCPEQQRCLIDLGEVTCEGDCSEAKNLSFTTTMVVPDASRTRSGFEAINGDGSSLSLTKVP